METSAKDRFGTKGISFGMSVLSDGVLYAMRAATNGRIPAVYIYVLRSNRMTCTAVRVLLYGLIPCEKAPDTG
jgi:hypothetical protein